LLDSYSGARKKHLSSRKVSNNSRNRTETVNEAIRLLIRRYELSKIKASIESIREDTEKYPELSGVVESMREEEDG